MCRLGADEVGDSDEDRNAAVSYHAKSSDCSMDAHVLRPHCHRETKCSPRCNWIRLRSWVWRWRTARQGRAKSRQQSTTKLWCGSGSSFSSFHSSSGLSAVAAPLELITGCAARREIGSRRALCEKTLSRSTVLPRLPERLRQCTAQFSG
jgi:hypothetical protein